MVANKAKHSLGSLSDEEQQMVLTFRKLDSSTQLRVKAFFGQVSTPADDYKEKPVGSPKEAPWASDAVARASVIKRIREMGDKFDQMSESAYGDWLNTLPFEEFLELMDIGQTGKA